MVGGLGTQGDHLRWVLLWLLAPPAPELIAAPPVALLRTQAMTLLPKHLLNAYTQDEYHECISDEMT
jgi:hypothetical protein